MSGGDRFIADWVYVCGGAGGGLVFGFSGIVFWGGRDLLRRPLRRGAEPPTIVGTPMVGRPKKRSGAPC